MKKSIKKRIIKIVSIILCVLLVIGCTLMVIASNYLCNYAIDSQADYGIRVSMDGVFATPQEGSWFSEHAKDMYIKSSDGLKLHAFFIENTTENNNGNFMMVFHGYTSCAAQMSFFAEQFYDMGYSVLLPDARAHGLSEGRYIGMGWPERLDNLLWIDEILKINKNAKIGLFGISMGGSTVINTAGEDLPKQVVVAVEDCGYTSAMEQFSYQMKAIFDLPSFPLLNTAGVIAKIKSGVNLYDANSVKQAKKIKIPTLFIHGKSDTFVPYKMVNELYAAANCEKELLVIENAGHAQSASANPLLYWSTVTRFIDDAMQ